MKCQYCNIVDVHWNHIYKCGKKHGLNNREIRYNTLCLKYDYKFTKKYLEEQYINKRWSLPDFKKEHGLPYKQTEFLLLYWGIIRRNIKESCNDKRRDKCKSTCLLRYGVDNISKIEGIKEKKRKKFYNNYGVDNIFKDEEFKKNMNSIMLNKYGKLRLTNPEKIKEYYKNLSEGDKYKLSLLNSKRSFIFWDNVSDEKLKEWKIKKAESIAKYWKNAPEEKKKEIGKKFGEAIKKWWNSLSDEEKNKIIMRNMKNLLNNNFTSKLEKRVNNILCDWKITYVSQFISGYYSFDFLIGKKILLEVNGDFWHANPLIYKKEDIMPFPGKSMTVKQIWAKDNNKKKYAEGRGYKIIYIWEKDMKKMDEKQLSLFIRDQIERLKDEN